MSVVSGIRRVIHRTREAAGLAFYTKPRRFPVQYDMTVHNGSGVTKRFYIAIPIPPNTDHQRVIHEPMFTPSPSEFRTDERYGNRYAVHQWELRPGDIAEFHESFVVHVTPFRTQLDRRLTIDAYADQKGEAHAAYREPNRFVRSSDPEVIRLARELRGSETDVFAILKRFNRAVVTRLNYGDPIPGLYSSHDALTRTVVDCGGFDTLLAALCVSQGIPARIASGFWAVSKAKNKMHAWLEIMLPDGSWIPADPSVEHLAWAGRTNKSGRLGFVGSDRVVMSYGCDIPVQLGGNTRSADILQHAFVWSEQGPEGLDVNTSFKIRKVWRG
ncbi:hypothetical protein A3E39_04495 [Candidatus Uhrbacteria bacterium RIFCSPHIGHO2_12_FULL_60_25]|uniref:Transglutaminase-like domain-containing protein n=1 Tax=Candidatus Uhrbacteria bacterium RIFCSPHIGHO2_12_FULL_60_25 TaxID=1802399 RepID=A0A1F7UIM1_9BACT|nr:MAG: hypothetical protein A3D73_01045 [Candidatus Uhrbacteria bacterium RIFCSPHIGHO2_02_FULL_60_44]OGL78146.1 MAG: hypothetical protein A3E39_04495 [Candidatus Uhrbacteria bacterium RIFCSPHIGHO2_12_FULL_60_25]